MSKRTNYSNEADDACPLTCLVVGAGNRGSKYSVYATLFPSQMKVVGVAEPNQTRRDNLCKKVGTIGKEYMFSDWREAAEKKKFADFVIITTTDQHHRDPAVAFARQGYDILLEKPMAVTLEDCKEIVKVCKECNVTLAVCHVLRYTPWVTMIKDVIDSGRIGDVVNIRLTEPVGFWHFAHSYVRGNWRNTASSTSSLMAKSCHDLDLINYWMSPKRCTSVASFGNLTHFTKENKVGFWHFAHSFVRGNWRREDSSTFSLMSKSCHDVDLIAYWMSPKVCVSVSSFGKLSHFTKSNKPAQATSRCLDCPVEHECPYSAKKIYIDAYKSGNTGWPVKVITDIVDLENITEALRTGPYGKCVYDTDNDVVSHQVVNFQFDDGATANFSMVAFTKRLCAREVKVYGTKGEIVYEDGWDRMQICDFRTENTEYWPIQREFPSEMAGHGGADFQLVKTFIESLKSETKQMATGPEDTLRSHLLVFAAEKARLEKKVVNIEADGSFY
ncbi:hypothetical protein RRG08_041067 [Elysia crispata]|uniref:Oxidoreductase n=1 Tax=Elysia crispata TaxID=231223 RepID=A0AAE1CTV3_9GAST|nr:hypothetical protein RRG08_041067 [Elysia crispata]